MSKRSTVLLGVLGVLLLCGQIALAYLYWVRPPGSTHVVTIVKEGSNSAVASVNGHTTESWFLELERFTTNLADSGTRQRYIAIDVALEFPVMSTPSEQDAVKANIEGTIPAIRSVILEQIRQMTVSELQSPAATRVLVERLDAAIRPHAPLLRQVHITNLIIQ